MEFPKIQDFTFWNWLTLALGVLSIISFVNAFLNLKTRFRDWRAGQSKSMFEERAELYRKRVERFKVYDSFPSAFIADIIHFISNTAAAIGGILTLEALVMGLTYFLDPKFMLELFNLFVLMDLFLLSFATFTIGAHWVDLTNDYQKQGDMALKIINLINDGKKKGYIDDNDDLFNKIFHPMDSSEKPHK